MKEIAFEILDDDLFKILENLVSSLGLAQDSIERISIVDDDVFIIGQRGDANMQAARKTLASCMDEIDAAKEIIMGMILATLEEHKDMVGDVFAVDKGVGFYDD